MEEAAPRCGLLILPELWMIGYDFRKIQEQAVCPGDALMESLSRFAAYHRVTVAAGTVPLRREGALYNTAMVFGPDGCLQCTYSKEGFYGYLESELLRPGTGSSQTEIGGVTCGFAVCYELYFPELFSEIAARGADMAIVPMSWPAPRIERMQILARARAIETGWPSAQSTWRENIMGSVWEDIPASSIRKGMSWLKRERKKRFFMRSIIQIRKKVLVNTLRPFGQKEMHSRGDCHENYIAERNQMAADMVIAALKRRHIEGVYAEIKKRLWPRHWQ